ncbi:hypothetical protein [Dokdonella sp.]|uniref:hypothetical protein n=1 Tax=Dokdonella sp. TaxID=2291710 RepID=UPI002F419C54
MRHLAKLAGVLLWMAPVLAGATECSDGIDNDADGYVDMASWYCKVPADNDEGSFRSGVPGDDGNFPRALDTWFDTNTGAGDDGCSMHACCDIQGACPPDLDPSYFDPAQCQISQTCRDAALPLTRPGCDCFGCCEICEPGTGCVDVFVNPVVSPSCTLNVLGDASLCRRCVQNPGCVNPSRIFADGFEMQSPLHLTASGTRLLWQ